MISRRQLLVSSAIGGGGLLLGVGVGPGLLRLERQLAHAPPLGDPGWILIGSDESVRLFCTLSEMGQGVWSALAQLLNEELEADPARIRVEMAPAWRAYSAPLGFYTGGSASIIEMFTPMRSIGAAARMMLVEAGASRWSVPAKECHVAAGYVIHTASGRRASYGQLAADAARLPVPGDPPLKPRSEWRSIGHSLPRIDARSVVDGSAEFGLDVRLPGMLVAAVAQSPWPGGRANSIDHQSALRQPGVLRLLDLGDTVAVVGRSYWSASRGLVRAAVSWRRPADVPDTERLRAELLAMTRPVVSPENSAASSARVVRATYEAPLLMHAQLEPLNATASVHRFEAELWAPTQAAGRMREEVARALHMIPQAVTVHATRVGGGFGRRLLTEEGVAAARIAREMGVPIKAIWSREEDSAQDHFRPMSIAHLETSLDPTGTPKTLGVRVASLGNRPRTAGLDPTPYAIPDTRVSYEFLTPALRIGFWRSVDASQNVFFRECFLDECAHAADADPLEYRLRLLGDGHARGRRVLETLAEVCGWRNRASSRFTGLAYHEGFGSISAQAVEISRGRNSDLHLERITVVVDCGTAVNPSGIRAQLEGGSLFALSAALREEATFRQGRLQQINFDTYSVLRIREAPPVEVRILETPGAAVGGMGEVGVPPLAPALANALFAATGQRLRRLPLRHAGFRWA